MINFVALVSRLHSYQFAALDRNRVARDQIDHSVKMGTLKLVLIPPMCIATIPALVIAAKTGVDATPVIILVTAFVSVFGFSWFTDRVYDQRLDEIKRHADQILDDTDKGRGWARRKIAAIVLIQLAVLFIVAGLGRLAVVYGSQQAFFAL